MGHGWGSAGNRYLDGEPRHGPRDACGAGSRGHVAEALSQAVRSREAHLARRKRGAIQQLQAGVALEKIVAGWAPRLSVFEKS